MSYKEIGKIFGKLAINFFEVCKPKLAQWQLQLLQKSMQVSWYRIAPPQKSLSRPTIYPQKSAPRRPAAAGAGRILPVNCRRGRLFWGRFYNGETFMEPAIF